MLAICDPCLLVYTVISLLTLLSDTKTGGSSSETNLATHPNLPLPSILKPPRGTNKSGYKYKYPEAAPTPEGEDDDEWNKVYTAADSRFYNKHGKSSQASKKYRQSRETYELAVTMIADKKQKARNDYNSQAAELNRGGSGGGSGGAAILPPKTATPKPRVPTKKVQPPSLKQELSSSSRDETPAMDRMPLSISEQIKQEGRPRKAPSAAPSSHQGTPAPSTASKIDSPPPKIEKPPPPKAVKKKGTAAPARKPTKQSQESTCT